MPAVAIIGGQWGDEGKGKVIDLLAEKANVVVRFSGGNNAGHTVINKFGEFKMHLIPSGIFYPGVACLIGNGVVIDPAALLSEVETLKKHGISVKNLFVSDRAHLIMPYHILLDGLEEKARGKGAIGTTLKGVGPAFVDKTARMGIRICDLLDKETFKRRLSQVLEQKNSLLTRLYDAPPLSLDEVFQKYCQYGEKIAPFVRETDVILREALRKGEKVMLEGAQGSMLDLDFGTYPYVTSASVGGTSLSMGLGIGSMKIDGVVAVFKAYTTRVGGGPFPTELLDECGNTIRERAHEYGTTTGRPRRCGWFDGVVARYSAEVNGLTSAAITRFDILDTFPTIKVCTAYKAGSTTYHRPPSNLALFEKCQPIYEELPGWQSPTDNIRSFKKLPPQAQAYVRKLEQLIGCPVSIISVGPAREQTIVVKNVL
ncbi:MAG TPA: adenylosuccinate synthase [Dehalococcoidia bacterium]|nr:adenylosuccinate synthase [Dehalococcoidia bacterium]